jgi:hypothetical protein
LTGHVLVSGSSDGIDGVLVEVCGSAWNMKGGVFCKKLLGSVKTDANGNFSFPSIKVTGSYFLRFFGYGVAPLFVRVQLRPSGTPKLTIKLQPAA